MKRLASLLLAVLALAVMPAHAEPSWSGTVRVGTLSPTPARLLYNQSPAYNGTIGYVIALPAGADGKPYSLKRTYGPTGREDLDAYFYTSLSDGGACDTGSDWTQDGDTERGTVCPHPAQTARFAIIVLKAGAETGFSFSVGP